MAAMDARTRQAIEEITGNEALLEMLDAEAANELLNWGVSMVTMLVNETAGMDEGATQAVLEPRLKAVRQVMRSLGNWAAGKYVDPTSRSQLRDKLLEYFKIIDSMDMQVLSSVELDSFLNQVDDENKTPLQLVVSFKGLLEKSN